MSLLFRFRYISLLAALLLLSLSAQAIRQTTLSDDFSRYPEGSDAAAVWDTGAIGWSVRGQALSSEGSGRSLALPLAAPHTRKIVLEAVVRPQRATHTEWKLAGLVLLRDDGNYWHLALGERPDSLGKSHFVELTEMYRGRWLANFEGETRLTIKEDAGSDFVWQYHQPYRLRLEVTGQEIRGEVLDMEGAVRVRKVFAFEGRPAVTSGRPALFTGSMAASFDDFRAEIREIAPPPPAPVYPAYTPLNPGPIRGKRTGYFHVEQIKGRWWLIDPQGRLFYAVGTDHVNYNVHWCEKLGYAPYHRNVAAKFGSEEKWAADAVARLKRWGFNALGAGNSPSTRHRGLAYTEFLSLGTNFTAISDIAPRTTWTGFPDVFHPRFARWCEQEAKRLCAPLRNDPWLLGYFHDNELEWYGKNASETGLVDETMKKPADHPAKKAWIAFLKKRYPAIGAFNRAWGVRVADWETLAQSVQPILPETAGGKKDRREFVLLIADRYFSITAAAIRKADPNHMTLGSRFAGTAPLGIFAAAGRHCDIVTVNYYGQVDLERRLSPDMPQAMRRYYAEAKRPMMITEWSFPALDAGLPSQHGAGQRVATQKDRARCYSIYQRALFSLPFMVGSNFFMWVDEPALGISSTFPEDSNYGLVDVNDNPWKELTQTASRINRMALPLHAGDTTEIRVEAREGRGRTAEIIIRNRGRRAATVPVSLWIQGKEQTLPLSLRAGQTITRRFPVRGAAFIAVEADPEERTAEADQSDNYAELVVLPQKLPHPAIFIVNPSAQTLTNVPAAVSLTGLRGDWSAGAVGGQSVTAQIDYLPEGAEMALRIPRLAPRNVLTVPLRPDHPPASQRQSGGDRALTLPGPLRLERDRGSGDFFDRVLLGDLPLGRFRALIQETGKQSLWSLPNRMERIEQWEGPARTLLRMTASLTSPSERDVKTEVSAEGAYAPMQNRPHPFRTVYQITRWHGEAWFAARFLSLENTDSSPWLFAAYFYYPVSAIGGKAEDDQPRNILGAPIWHDAAEGASYGALVDMRSLRAYFWKDQPDSASQHPDIYRTVQKRLLPGQVFRATAADPEVLFLGTHATDTNPGGEVLSRLRALARVRAILRIR
jgi:hypothetical protein